MTKLLALIVLTLLVSPAFAHDDRDDGPRHYHGAPGPVAGAGLPALAVGYGVYWLARRRQRSNARPDHR